MATPQQRKARARKQLIERRIVVAVIAVLFLGTAVVLWILNGSWSNLFSIIFVFASALIGLFQWLFPVTGPQAEQHTPLPAPSHPPVTPGPVQLVLAPAAPAGPVQPASNGEKPVYRGIMGLPPPTDERTIQQRQKAVQAIYARLSQPGMSAVALTGIGGVGKSTLAALVYKYAEEQRRAGLGAFTDPAIWLNVDPAATMADLVGNLCEIFDKPLPDLSNLSLQHQALLLCNMLNTPDERRLLVLDQFENLLDWQTGHALADRPGVAEWLDALNSQPSHSRLLLTTRPWPLGTREYPPTCMQEYTVRRLEPEEGLDLLRKSGVEASDEALYTVVERCGGHAFALTLLASLLRSRRLTLAAFLNDRSYAHVWTGNVARNLLDSIFTSQLNEVQRQLLLAFSVYREPVPLSAASALCDFATPVSAAQIQQALDALLAQHLLQPAGDGSYQLHAIVEGYAHDHFALHDDQANAQALRSAHARATRYYLQLAASNLPPGGQRTRLSDYDPLIEVAWHYSRAHQWHDAYAFIEGERLFSELKTLGGLVVSLELLKLLLPLGKWQNPPATPQEGARIYNYLGSIYRSLGRRELAQQHLEQALKLSKEAGDSGEEGWSLNHLGRLYASMGEKERALSYYEQALTHAQANHDRILQAAIFNNFGWIYSAWGKQDLEQKYYTEALAIYRATDDRTGQGITLGNLGRASEDAGDYEQARRYYQEALALFQALGNQRACGWTLNNLGRSSYSLGDDKEQARQYLEEALRIRREVDRRGEGRTLNNLAAVAIDAGDEQLARAYCLEALEISDEVTDREGRGKVLRTLGQLCLAQKRHAEALAFLLSARTILEEMQTPGREKLLDTIDRLHHEIGDESFFELLNTVEARPDTFIEQYLKTPLQK